MDNSLSVSEVLALPALEDAHIRAGHAGVVRRVRAMNVMEVPDILSWVHEDELLLTTAYPLRDMPDQLGRLVEQLHDLGLAGLLFKPGRYVDEVPAAMIEAADRLGFPLVVLPEHIAFGDIIAATLTAILDRQATRLKRTQEIRNHFNELVLTGGGFGRIAHALSEALDRPVVVRDRNGNPLGATAGVSLDDLPPVPAALLGDDAASDPAEQDELRSEDGQFLIKPVRANGQVLGAIFVASSPGDLTNDDREALRHAATVSALHQVHVQASEAHEERARSIVLEELVNEESPNWNALTERAATFGVDLVRPAVAAVITDDAAQEVTAASLSRYMPMRRLMDEVRAALGPQSIVWERASEVATFIAVDVSTASNLRNVAERLQHHLSAHLPSARLTIGFGRTAMGPQELQRSFGQARRALEVGRWSAGAGGGVFGFDELGVDRLLSFCDSVELEAYRDDWVGALLERDIEHKTDLISTLEQYLATRNIADTGRRLFVHPNTVRNHLASIESIVGPFIDDGERCLSLALALRILRLQSVNFASDRARREPQKKMADAMTQGR